MSEQDTIKVADGVAKALMRDELDRGEKLDRKLDDLEAKMRAKIQSLREKGATTPEWEASRGVYDQS